MDRTEDLPRARWGRALALSAVGLMGLAASCPPPAIETIEIRPTRLTTRCDSAHDSATFSCPPAPCIHGPYHEARCRFQDFITPNLAPIQVGFEHTYDPGTSPCACWDWFTESRRAYVLFGDLRPLEGRKIIWAKLNFTEAPVDDGPTSCPASLWQVTGPAVSYAPMAVHLADNAASGTLVSDTVRAWQAGRDNHGFMFVSEGEGMTEQPNGRCVTERSNFILQVAITKPAS